MAASWPFFAQAAGTKTPPQPALVSRASFDYAKTTFLVANPLIAGTASSSVPLRFTVMDQKGTIVFSDSGLVVKNGRFAETIYPPISSGAYMAVITSGTSTLATSTVTIGLQSLPRVEPDYSLSSFDVSDGHLMRFAIQAEGTNSVGLAQLTFTVMPTNASVVDMFLYAYTDSGYTNPVTSDNGGLLNGQPVNISATSSVASVAFDTPLEIPAGGTYYFDLVGGVTPTDTTYSVQTTLLADSNGKFDTFPNLAPISNMVWSPNTYGGASFEDHDWINGDFVDGVPVHGFTQVRTNSPPTNAPSCTVTASTSTAPTGTPFALTWNSSDAYKAVWDTGAVDAVSGTKNYTVGSTTRTYILNVTGRYGQSDCFATVVVPQAVVSGTTTVATTTSDSFTATPLTGSISLSVTFKGSVNNAKACTAQTFSLGFGDGATSTILVPANSCKAQSFTFTHSYTKVGTFTAGLYKGTGTSTAQRIQIQTITTKAKVSILFDAGANVANALSAFMDAFSHGLRSFRNFWHFKK